MWNIFFFFILLLLHVPHSLNLQRKQQTSEYHNLYQKNERMKEKKFCKQGRWLAKYTKTHFLRLPLSFFFSSWFCHRLRFWLENVLVMKLKAKYLNSLKLYLFVFEALCKVWKKARQVGCWKCPSKWDSSPVWSSCWQVYHILSKLQLLNVKKSKVNRETAGLVTNRMFLMRVNS